MKQFIMVLFAVLSLCTSIYAQDFLINSTTTALNAAKNNISTQTLLIQNSNGNISLPFELNDVLNDVIEKGIIVSIISTIVVFACPVFILFIIFFFRYKNRKARYHLAEQALAAGQPLPDNLIKEKKTTDQQTQGIRNTFTGIGIFIFLWALTGKFSIGAIGLLVMFMGIGQWITGYKQQKKNSENK